MNRAAILAIAAILLAPACRPAPMTTLPAGAPAPTPAASPAGAQVTMSSDPPVVKVGTPVTLSLRIARGSEVFGVPFHVTFDPAVVRYDSAAEGAFLRRDGAPTTFLTALSGPGRVVVGLSRLGQVGGVSGSGELCTIRFTALAPGNPRFELDAAAVVDPKGRTLEARFEAPDTRVEN